MFSGVKLVMFTLMIFSMLDHKSPSSHYHPLSTTSSTYLHHHHIIIIVNIIINQYHHHHHHHQLYLLSLRWPHDGHNGVSNHQPHHCLLDRLFGCRSKKTSKLRVTGLCVGNSPVPGEFPTQRPVTQKMFPFDDVIMSSPSPRRPCHRDLYYRYFY